MQDFRRMKWSVSGSTNSVAVLGLVPRISMIVALDNFGQVYLCLTQANSNSQIMALFDKLESAAQVVAVAAAPAGSPTVPAAPGAAATPAEPTPVLAAPGGGGVDDEIGDFVAVMDDDELAELEVYFASVDGAPALAAAGAGGASGAKGIGDASKEQGRRLLTKVRRMAKATRAHANR